MRELRSQAGARSLPSHGWMAISGAHSIYLCNESAVSLFACASSPTGGVPSTKVATSWARIASATNTSRIGTHRALASGGSATSTRRSTALTTCRRNGLVGCTLSTTGRLQVTTRRPGCTHTLRTSNSQMLRNQHSSLTIQSATTSPLCTCRRGTRSIGEGAGQWRVTPSNGGDRVQRVPCSVLHWRRMCKRRRSLRRRAAPRQSRE